MTLNMEVGLAVEYLEVYQLLSLKLVKYKERQLNITEETLYQVYQ